MKSEGESEPLTNDCGETGLREWSLQRDKQLHPARRARSTIALLIVGTIILSNAISIISTMGIMRSGLVPGCDVPRHYSPANKHIEYEYRYIGHDDGNSHLFMGEPRPEYEEAWDDLLQGTYIRLTQDELTRANNATSIGHKDGGFVGGLGVGHNLHCLKAIRHFLHPEHYPIESHQDKKVRENHLDHCLESLRQAVMCNVDFSLNTLEWTPEKDEKLSVTWSQPNRCVNWHRLHDWLKDRQTNGREFVREGIALERPT